MNFCHDYAESISALIDGELCASDEAELRRHMDTCEACQSLYADFTAMRDGFPGLETPPDTLVGGTLYRMSAEPTTTPAYRLRRVAASLVGVAACLILALFLSKQPTEIAPLAKASDSAMPESFSFTGGQDEQTEARDNGQSIVAWPPDLDTSTDGEVYATAGTPHPGARTPDDGENAEDLPLPVEGGGSSGSTGSEAQDIPPSTEQKTKAIPGCDYTRNLPPEFAGTDAAFILTLRVNDEGHQAIRTLLGEENITILGKNGHLAISSSQIPELAKAAGIQLDDDIAPDETGILYLEVITS